MRDDNQKVALGVVGLGSMGMAHCRQALDVEGIELRAVLDVDEEQAQKVGEQYGIPYFTDHEEMFDSGLVDAIIIATPHFYHADVAVAAFHNGVHVLCEKPLAVRASSARRMVEEAEKNDCKFAVMFQIRTEPIMRKARQIVENGELGRIRRTLLVLPEFRSQAYYDAGTWRATWAGEGGGPLLNQGPHMMDIFLMLGGLPSQVLGWTRTVMHDIEVEDEAEARLTYENGASGYLYVSTCEPGPGFLLQIFGDKGKLRIMGEQMSFVQYDTPVEEFSKNSDSMWGSPKAERSPIELPEANSGQAEIMRNFAAAILHGEELLSPARAGLNQLELSNAIMLSSWTDSPVSIPVDREKFDALLDERIAKSSFEPGGESQTTRITDPKLG
ncbi:MAG: Gfo/Idh/MocA family oxidoreductase [Planctomycetes bacterium]|nr:Gfo/Idh/MocA family oxidoreductase [Planctomycetota bacterium]